MPKPSNKQTKKDEPKKSESEEDVQNNVVDKTQSHDEDDNSEVVHSLTCNELDVKRLYFKAQKMEKKSKQLMCFPKYLYDHSLAPTPENFEANGDRIIILTKPIQMVKGGIPRHNAEYHGDNENSMKRAYFFIPKNEADPNSVEFFNCIQKIDDYLHDQINTQANKNSVFCILNDDGKRQKIKGITYKRMITTAKQPGTGDMVSDDEGETKKKPSKNDKDDGKHKFTPWERVKVKLSTEWDETLGPNDLKPIDTQLYIPNVDEPQNCTTVTDFEKYFSWNCTAQFALVISKVWIKKDDSKECSISIKCIQIGVTKLSDYKKGASITKQLKASLFGSSSKKQVDAEEPEAVESKSKPNSSKSNDKSAKNSGKAKQPEPEPEEEEGSDPEKDASDAEGSDVEKEASDAEESGDEKEESEAEASEAESEPEPPKKGKKGDVLVKGKGKAVSKSSDKKASGKKNTKK
jgi:hypothetical protein